MTENEVPRTPSDVIGRRLKEVRKRRGWNTQALADACRKAGGNITQNAIENIESGRRLDGERRRFVTVDELLLLAYALDVAPIHLVVPIEPSFFYVIPKWVTPGERVREWIRGNYALETTDPRIYFSEVPRTEWRAPAQPDGDELDRQAMSARDFRALMEEHDQDSDRG